MRTDFLLFGHFDQTMKKLKIVMNLMLIFEILFGDFTTKSLYYNVTSRTLLEGKLNKYESFS